MVGMIHQAFTSLRYTYGIYTEKVALFPHCSTRYKNVFLRHTNMCCERENSGMKATLQLIRLLGVC